MGELEWKGKKIERVDAFRYLGFVFRSTGGYGKQVRWMKGKAR